MTPRIALYGHDTMGLGHLRRNLALARALAEVEPRPDVLLVTGASEVGRYALPKGVDVLTLPAVAKDEDGTYRSRRLAASLTDVVSVRSAVLSAGLEAFAPDLLVVDKVATGFRDELAPVLPALRAAGTHVVLGLRDILDAPATAAAEWRRQRTTEALRAWYDEVWVYGDARVADLARDCRIPPSVRGMLRHTGYLSAGRAGAASLPPGVAEDEPYVLGLLGGGQDGADLAATFAEALSGPGRPAGIRPVLLTGPYLPEDARRVVEQASEGSDLVVVPFAADAERWVERAAAVVCMGGYNTVAEVLATSTPALVVPRTTPRAEQLVRARRLSDLGLLDDIHPDDLTPQALAGWVASAVTGPRTSRAGLALDGLTAVRAFAAEALAARPATATPTGTAHLSSSVPSTEGASATLTSLPELPRAAAAL